MKTLSVSYGVIFCELIT